MELGTPYCKAVIRDTQLGHVVQKPWLHLTPLAG